MSARIGVCGFKQKPSGKLDTNAPGFGVNSDWPDLNDLCDCTGVSLEWKRADNETVSVSKSVITDLSINVRATVSRDGTPSVLPSISARSHLLAQRAREKGELDRTEAAREACLPPVS